MHITTSGRYGLRVMLDLALNGAEGPVLRQDIAPRHAISAEYNTPPVQAPGEGWPDKNCYGPGGRLPPGA
jgi:hypothetical protein